MEIERHGRPVPRQTAAGVTFRLSMIFSENRFPLFGIMLSRRDGAMEGLLFPSGRPAGNC
jgi:hypothetical protein